MRRTILLLVFSLGVVLLSGQEAAEALLVVWHDEGRPDSLRARAYYDYVLGSEVLNQPDSVMVLAEALETFAGKADYPKARSLANYLKGTSFFVTGNYKQAIEYYESSLAIDEQIGDGKGMALALVRLGVINNDIGNYREALAQLQRSLEIQAATGNRIGLANSLNHIGNIYDNQGNFPRALDYHQRSLGIREAVGDTIGVAASLGNIGNIYVAREENLTALDYYQRALAIFQENDHQYGAAACLTNIGIIYAEEGDYEQALDFYQRSLAVREALGDPKGIANTLGNIGNLYSDRENFSEALNYLRRSLEIRRNIGDTKGVASTLNDIGGVYKSQGNYRAAIDECRQAFELSERIGSLDLQKEVCTCLYESYKILGNGSEALRYHELMLAADDSLQLEETSRKLQQMEFAKQVLQDSIANAEKERAIEEAHLQEVRSETRTRNIILGVAAFLLLAAGGFYNRWRYIQKSHAVISREKDRSESLLLNILPAEIAQELKTKGRAEARTIDPVAILFTDFQGFTEQSTKLSAAELVHEINQCFEAFDGITEEYGIEKIKTIGDSYMAAGGLPSPNADSVRRTVLAALAMQSFIVRRKARMDLEGKPAFAMRVGIHTGPVVAGIVGVKKFQYDIWGDTVNTASRMESSGRVGEVNISKTTYLRLKDDPAFRFTARGKIRAKGKGEMEMYFVTAAPP